MTPEDQQLIVRGTVVGEDERGWICLDDIWALAKARPTQKPKHWRMGGAAIALGKALLKKVRNSDLFPKNIKNAVVYAKRGRGSAGTYAHPIMAAAYAGYLHPDLEVEMREVWLRYRKGDATLADEILQRASVEANKWVGLRALSRVQRRQYTDVLKDHGVTGSGYSTCTEAMYMSLLGARARTLRIVYDVPKSGSLRDSLPTDNLSYVMAAEALSAERIIEEGRQGNDECARATARSASAIRNAIEADRKDRQIRLVA